MDHLGEGHQLVLRIRPVRQIGHGALLHHRRGIVDRHHPGEHATIELRPVERGDVDARDPREGSQQLGPGA